MTHSRVTAEGRALGKLTAKLAERGQERLRALGLTILGLPGLRDAMCKTCACRIGSLPNGCPVTQMDFLKAAVEGVPFLCHAPKDGRICAGWAGARAAFTEQPAPPDLLSAVAAHSFSLPDVDSIEE